MLQHSVSSDMKGMKEKEKDTEKELEECHLPRLLSLLIIYRTARMGGEEVGGANEGY